MWLKMLKTLSSTVGQKCNVDQLQYEPKSSINVAKSSTDFWGYCSAQASLNAIQTGELNNNQREGQHQPLCFLAMQCCVCAMQGRKTVYRRCISVLFDLVLLHSAVNIAAVSFLKLNIARFTCRGVQSSFCLFCFLLCIYKWSSVICRGCKINPQMKFIVSLEIRASWCDIAPLVLLDWHLMHL